MALFPTLQCVEHHEEKTFIMITNHSVQSLRSLIKKNWTTMPLGKPHLQFLKLDVQLIEK